MLINAAGLINKESVSRKSLSLYDQTHKGVKTEKGLNIVKVLHLIPTPPQKRSEMTLAQKKQK